MIGVSDERGTIALPLLLLQPIDTVRLLVARSPRAPLVLVTMVFLGLLRGRNNHPTTAAATVTHPPFPWQRRPTTTTTSRRQLRVPPHHRRSRALYELNVTRDKGLPVTLTCNSKSTTSRNASQSGSVHKLHDSTITFAYEIAITDPKEDLVEVLLQDLPKVEYFLLYYVAKATGVLDCDLDDQNIPLFANDTVATPAKSKVDVMSLSSEGPDFVDPTVDQCLYLVDLAPGLICLPLNGTMKATFDGNETDRSAVENFLTVHIKRVVDSADFRGMGVNSTLFLGSRILPVSAPPAIVGDGERGVDKSSSSNVALASSLSAAAVVIVCLIYFAFAKRRRPKPETSAAVATGRDKQQVMVSGDMQPLTVAPTKTTVANSCSVSDEEKSDEARCGSVDLENRLGREVVNPDQEVPSVSIAAAYSLATARTASTVVSTDESVQAPEDDITEKATNVKTENVLACIEPPNVVDILQRRRASGPSSKPPVPPAAASKVPLAQRRRKKKKKKQKLVRANSRENVAEMETITEGEEETSGDNNGAGEDDGSEYSWCSTSDSNPSSRDPSPARSHGSREPSPARSTDSSERDGAVAAMSHSETWDNSSNGLAAATSSTDSGDRPKPNRLPPHWF